MIGVFLKKQIKTQQNYLNNDNNNIFIYKFRTPPDLLIGKNTKILCPEKGRQKLFLYPKISNIEQ